MDYNELLKLAINAAFKAGEEILKIYSTDFYVETKSDNTPVTLADRTSGECISKILSASNIPIISEEEEILDYSIRKTWPRVWIVDPLDGTKEYVKRNGEFAVNIALVENNKPVIGIIYAPVLKDIYFAYHKGGSYKITQHDMIMELTKKNLSDHLFEFAKKLPSQKLPKTYTVVGSRSHLSREINVHVDKLRNLYGDVDMISVGSSIKQCWVAEGKAHEYLRYGTTMEWDTAAGQCILEEAGCQLIDLETNLPMVYNREDMHNNYFIAKCGSRSN
ncbi:3'(2'),5'-bisphosphate nucleotidase [Sphingobacteriaceae bacterium]|nr:3'(2'),5'-bisphosphate nucleotidase [Sphingobacteriaceae bacterium]